MYIDLYRRRSYSQVAKMAGYSYRTIMRIAKIWNWKERALKYDKHNYKTLYLETSANISDLNFKKINQKISLSASFQEAIDQLQNYLTYYELAYKLPEAKEKIVYLQKVSRMLAYMLKMQDLSVSGIVKDIAGHNFDIVSVFKDRLSSAWTPNRTPRDLKDVISPPPHSDGTNNDNKLDVEALNKLLDDDVTNCDIQSDNNVTKADKT
ncbi:MAG: hypothetical protein EPN82_06760 [Bacteroidetes bacterium]|nr:MAG: hypothetical protein EPN82_06760 [Bacteroidota bacterium]